MCYREIRLFVFFMLVISFSSFACAENHHPNMFLNQKEIDAIKQKVLNDEEPWKSAYNSMIRDADAALKLRSQSVTFQGSTRRNYFTEKPYCGWKDEPKPPCGNNCCDGHVNPKADRGDFAALDSVSSAIRNLGLGYAFSGNSAYADKAIELIRIWATDPSTGMVPTTNINNRIDLFVTIPGIFYGADLVWNYPGWSEADKDAFASWVSQIGVHAKDNGACCNNWENWRLVFISSAGAYTNNQAMLDYSFNQWKDMIPKQIQNSGRMDWEYGRSVGLSYSMFAILAMSETAEIAKHRGVDLYNYTDENGRGIERAADFHVQYMIKPSSWSWSQMKPYTGQNSAVYEMLYSHFKKPEYLTAINAWGRPMYDDRIMGYVTLTHANLFTLNLADPGVPQLK